MVRNLKTEKKGVGTEREMHQEREVKTTRSSLSLWPNNDLCMYVWKLARLWKVLQGGSRWERIQSL